MISPVNAFQVKRAAHGLSRGDSGWNPFRHTYRAGESRRQTWDIPESQRPATSRGPANNDDGDDRQATSSPLGKSRTLPEGTSGTIDARTTPHLAGASRQAGLDDSAAVQQGQQGATQEVMADGLSGGQAAAAAASTTPAGPPQDQLRRRTATARENGLDSSSGQDSVNKETGAGRDAGNAPPKPEADKKKRTYFKHLQPKTPFTVGNQIRRTLLNSWINLLLVAAPVGIAINYIHSVSRVAVFVVNFIAIVPLAAMLSFATEEIALRTGESLGGLLNATFG